MSLLWSTLKAVGWTIVALPFCLLLLLLTPFLLLQWLLGQVGVEIDGIDLGLRALSEIAFEMSKK